MQIVDQVKKWLIVWIRIAGCKAEHNLGILKAANHMEKGTNLTCDFCLRLFKCEDGYCGRVEGCEWNACLDCV
jgi:hypothetical protein